MPNSKENRQEREELVREGKRKREQNGGKEEERKGLRGVGIICVSYMAVSPGQFYRDKLQIEQTRHR